MLKGCGRTTERAACHSSMTQNSIPPQVGTTYIKVYRGKVHSMKVVLENGRVGYRVAGVTHKTPTGAASPITKAPWSGWQFWGIEAPPPPTRRKGNRWSVTVR